MAAIGGNHAVTHQAVDRHLSLPRGSTSYYFRTRDALISAAAGHLVERSRAAFAEQMSDEAVRARPGDLIADYLDDLLTTRRRDALARHGLLQDPSVLPDTREKLARCFFSVDAATDLMRDRACDDAGAAADVFITVLEGIVFTYTYGVRRDHGRVRGELAEQLRPLVVAALRITDASGR
nr:TetR family transcriptional regulator [Gordonia sp. SID5947]